MTALLYSSPRARYLDSNANPLAFGRVTYYFPGTTTLKEVYTDLSGDTPATNPHLLDAEGYVRDGGLWGGEGYYDVLLEESDGGGGFNTLWTMPNVLGEAFTSSGDVGDVAYIRTINDLINLPAGTYGAAYVFGYYEENDGGQGWFLWNETSTDTEDGGSVISPLGSPASGRWLRNFEDDHINVNQWGACETSPSAVNSNLQKCFEYADSADPKHSTVVFPEGTLEINSSFNCTGTSTNIIFKSGAAITASTAATFSVLTANASVEGGLNPIVLAQANLVWSTTTRADAYLEWWSATDLTALINSAGNYNGDLVFTGSYSFGAISGAIVHSNWRIREYASLNFTALGDTCTISNYNYPLDSLDCFKGSWNALVIGMRELPINHFENALSTSTKYIQFLNILESGKILWAGQQTYASVPAYINTTPNNVVSEVVAGSLLSFDNNLWIGGIVNDPTEYIVSTASTAFPITSSSVIYLGWLGAKPLNSITLQSVFDAASLWANGMKWISGNNDRYFVADTDDIEFYTASSGVRWRVKDITFDGISDSNASTITVRNLYELSNVNFEFTNTGAGEFNIGTSSDFGAARIPEGTWRNSTTDNTTLDTHWSNGTYQDLILGPDFTTLGCGVYTRCQIGGTGLANFELYQETAFPAPVTFTDCTINAEIIVYANVGVTFQGNVINTGNEAITLRPSTDSVSQIATRFLITGNRFIYAGGSPDTLYGVELAGAWADDGHLACHIADNIHLDLLTHATKYQWTQVSSFTGAAEVTIGTGGVSWPIFPRLYSSGALPRTAQVTVRHTTTPASPYRYAVSDVDGGSGGIFSATWGLLSGSDNVDTILTWNISVNDTDITA